MIPKTALETAIHASKNKIKIYKIFSLNNNNKKKKACLFPFYMNRSCMESDPIEKFKYVIVTTISSFYFTNTFLKPVFFFFY